MELQGDQGVLVGDDITILFDRSHGMRLQGTSPVVKYPRYSNSPGGAKMQEKPGIHT